MDTVIIRLCIAFLLLCLWLVARQDWVRWRGEAVRVTARVTGHRLLSDADGRSYAAILSFSDETGKHEVVDVVYRADPKPPVGAMVALRYPRGRPDLARVPRPLVVALIYGSMLVFLALLIAADRGWIG